MPLSPQAAEQLRQKISQGTYGNQSAHSASGPGVLQELFNFISRPSRASAALAYDLTGGGGNPFKDVMGALAGHGTHTYRDVINNVAPGLPSWMKTVGGFAGDVAFDPLTYVTGGITKGIGGLEASTQALKGLTEAGGIGARGLRFTPELLDSATQAVKAANPSSLELGFKIPFSGGKKIMASTANLPGEMGAKLSDSYNALKDVVIGPESARRSIPRAFSRASELPLTSDVLTNNQAVAHSLMGDTKQHIEGMFGKNLTDEEQKTIAKVWDEMSREAMDTTRKNPRLGSYMNDRESTLKAVEDEFGIATPHPLSRPDTIHPEGYQDLGDYHHLAKNLHRKYIEEERALGLPSGSDFRSKFDVEDPEVLRAMDDALPRYYHYDFDAPRTGVGKKLVNEHTGQEFYNERAYANSHSLDDPAIAHYNPVTNIQDIMGIRTGTHFKDVGLANYNLEALKQVGIPLNAKTRQILAEGTPGIGNFVKIGEDTLGHPTAGLPEFKNMYIPEVVADSMRKVNQALRSPKEAREAMQTYDKVLRGWKKANTVYSPGFHVHNSISDFLMNWADGVKNPQAYKNAAKVLSDASNKTSASFLEHLSGTDIADEMLGATGIKTAIATPKTVTLGGKQFDTDTINDLLRQSHGGIVGQLKTEAMSAADQAASTGSSKAKDLIEKGKNALGSVNGLADKASALSASREKFFRSAHWLDVVDKEVAAGATLEEAAAKAVGRVRKFNIDYTTQTDFEKNVMRRVIPFYSWARRNLPLQAQMLFTHPGFMAGYAKGQTMLNGGVVGSTDVNGDPLLPQWLRDSMPVRLATGKAQDSVLSKFLSAVSGGRAGEGVYTNLASSLTPMNDLAMIARPIDKAIDAGSIAAAPLNLARGLVGEGTNMLTPAIKLPVELGMNKNLSTGAPLDLKGVKDWAGYIGAQTAVGRVGAGSTDPSNRPKTLTNWLSGVNLTPVTPNRQTSEFIRQQTLIQKHLRELRGEEAKKRNIPNTEFTKTRISKLNNPQIQKLKTQLRQLQRLSHALPPDYQSDIGQAGYVNPFG